MDLSKSAHLDALDGWEDRDFGLRLGELETHLGSDLIRVVRPDRESDPFIRALDIYDARSGSTGGEGVLLSVVSADAMRPDEFRRALDDAHESGCAGVVVKVEEGSEAAASAIRDILERGLAAVVLAAYVSWREFDALLTRVLGEHAQTLDLAPSTGDKLFALANTVARVYGGSVAIEDHQRGILAHSSVQGQAIDDLRTTGILFRRAGDAPVNERRYRDVLAADGIVRFDRHDPYLPRAAIAIRAGSIPLGTIWALDPDGDRPSEHPLSHEKAQVLTTAATLAADTLLESWRQGSRHGSRREAAFKRMLISANRPGDRELLDPTADEIGIIVLAAVPRGTGAAVRLSEIRSVLARYLAMYVPDMVIIIDGHEIVAWCPATRVETVQEWMTSALSELSEDTLRGLSIGLSDPHPIGHRLMYAVDEAREVAAAVDRANSVVGTVAMVRPQLFISACRRQLDLDDRLVLPEVRELVDRGEESRHLLDTLECWMEESGNVGRTARRLRVHEQTVRYRMRKLRTLLPITDHGPDTLLTVWAQLRALRWE
ncbi:helix-turn-helix domain-containing protein [Leucobacter rhizosphaerae]|uniref:Helix-turn-helix domain-containing protein n=1 Tax=Leucobacter rhizosphaerae TaxID=2932245 RepID=A0ABY4FTN9_9MICO|nr:PucR family transcriptional regulator [Leucobacter rhizosphaerae]UOQ59611.1 helix-turn-helix domain-containing protein [Leucobacter rhizosphaerae]